MCIKDCTLEGTVVARGEFVGVLTSEGVRSNLFDGVTGSGGSVGRGCSAKPLNIMQIHFWQRKRVCQGVPLIAPLELLPLSHRLRVLQKERLGHSSRR